MAGPWLSLNQVIQRLRREVRGNQFAWADRHGISAAYVSDVLSGRRLPGKKITEAMGLEAALLWRVPSQPQRKER
jgi:DNA-binding transcriptional regulator YdaS (Cro superfamily)